MKKIYRVQLALSFNTRNALLPFLKARDEILGKSEFIFASSDQEAINIYDSIHEDAVSLWDDCYNVIHFPRILNKKDPNFDSYYYINLLRKVNNYFYLFYFLSQNIFAYHK